MSPGCVLFCHLFCFDEKVGRRIHDEKKIRELTEEKAAVWRKEKGRHRIWAHIYGIVAAALLTPFRDNRPFLAGMLFTAVLYFTWNVYVWGLEHTAN